MASPAVLPGTEQHILHSSVIDDDFEITVIAPPPELTVGATPVVYGTDATVALGAYASTLTLLQIGAEIPPVTFVGVGYPNGGNFSDWVQRRVRDFTPSSDPWSEEQIGGMAQRELKGGGANAFIEFLVTELRPWVTQNHDVLDDSTLIGHSLGGLFATHALFHESAPFDRYLIASPWLAWDDEVVLRAEREHAVTRDDLAANVFLGAGGAEDVLSPVLPAPGVALFATGDVAHRTTALAARLQARRYPGLQLTTKVFRDETHFTVGGVAYAHGLRHLFRRERLNLRAA